MTPWFSEEMMYLSSSIFMVVAITSVLCQNDDTWRPEDFPNPRTDVDRCGRDGPSYVCDPDSYLSVSNADMLDYSINKARNETKCACNNFYCGEVNTRGIKIGIAVVNKMNPMRDNDESLDLHEKLTLAAQFAQRVDEDWSLGECGDTILILYSVNDHVLFTHTGATTKETLHNTHIAAISMQHRGLFASGKFYEGFAHVISDYKAVLQNKYEKTYGEPIRPADPQALRSSSGSGGLNTLVSSLLMLAITLALHFVKET